MATTIIKYNPTALDEGSPRTVELEHRHVEQALAWAWENRPCPVEHLIDGYIDEDGSMLCDAEGFDELTQKVQHWVEHTLGDAVRDYLTQDIPNAEWEDDNDDPLYDFINSKYKCELKERFCKRYIDNITG